MTDPSVFPSSIIQSIGAIYAIFVAVLIFSNAKSQKTSPKYFKIISFVVLLTLLINGFFLYLLNVGETYASNSTFKWSEISYVTFVISVFSIILYSVKLVEFDKDKSETQKNDGIFLDELKELMNSYGDKFLKNLQNTFNWYDILLLSISFLFLFFLLANIYLSFLISFLIFIVIQYLLNKK
jgi:hypothetical protein